MVDYDVVSGCLTINPIHIFLNVGGIYHEEEVVVPHLVHQQVIYGAAVGVEHHSIEDFPFGRVGNVVSENVVNKSLGICSGDSDLAHVRDVEHAAVIAHGVVFSDDVGILYGHVETAEWAH